MHETLPLLRESTFPAIQRDRLETLQVNLGYRCNQSCLHCHVNAGPNRKEMMDETTLDQVIHFLASPRIRTLDLTGGAPEMHPGFRHLVKAARVQGAQVIDRCNLTVLLETGQEGTARFLADNRVEIVASLPCYIQENVDRQRGEGVFEASIEALRILNSLGYGDESGALRLNLVYNPQEPVLPPPQTELEQDYKRHLADSYGIRFNRLLTLTNMPIKRFGSTLISHGQFDNYLQLLRSAHRNENLCSVMCKTLISIDWEGYVYDCDFNQMLGIPATIGRRLKTHITEMSVRDLDNNSINVADHCYACTAGQGSSCGGALET